MTELALILYGSQNYGLDSPDSDHDYKALLCPSFEDWFYGHKVSKDDLRPTENPEHYSPMDVIRFHELLMKGNPNCIEMLFSREQYIFDEGLNEYLDSAKELYRMGYVAVVWDDFYPALKGIALNSIKRNGVNNKTISRAYYFQSMITILMYNGFEITQSTWRDDSNMYVSQRYAQHLRFNAGQDEIDAQAVTIPIAFDDLKEKSFNATHEWIIHNKECCIPSIQSKKSVLEYKMRSIVAKNIKEDIRRYD